MQVEGTESIPSAKGGRKKIQGRYQQFNRFRGKDRDTRVSPLRSLSKIRDQITKLRYLNLSLGVSACRVYKYLNLESNGVYEMPACNFIKFHN
jgi:hypothetical protein